MFDPNKRVLILATMLAAILVTAAAFQRSADPVTSTISGEMNFAGSMFSPVQKLWVAMDEAERNGRYDDALASNAAIRTGYGDLYLINYRAGRLHYLKQDYAAAVESYRKAATLSPGAINPLREMANCYALMDQADRAIQTYQSLLVLDPMNLAANRRLADLQFQRQNYAAAEALYLKLSALYPEDLDVAMQFAWCQFHLKRAAQARAVFQSILVAAPGHVQALTGLLACDALKTSDSKE